MLTEGVAVKESVGVDDFVNEAEGEIDVDNVRLDVFDKVRVIVLERCCDAVRDSLMERDAVRT